MRVIKPPQNLEEWRQQCTCSRCKAELEYDISDLKYVPGGGDMRDSWPESFTITCAICQQLIEVPKTGITEYVKHVVITATRNFNPYHR